MIQVEQLDKEFSGKKVLEDINVEFEQGKANLIIGQSGSGKTVLLKSIVGLHTIDNGTVLYDGRDFHRLKKTEQKKVRQEMGMLFQGSALFDSYNVADNVRFPLDIFTNQSKAEKMKRVAFCLDRVNLHDVEHLLPSELSGGMKKRVAIARAISMNPKYLFCDEPNSGLDPKTSVVIDDLLLELTHDFNMTTIINTHDLNSMMGIGEKIVFISKGKVEWTGNRDDLLSTKNETLHSFIYSSKILKDSSN
ncbi:Glutamine transport ATP-binding protein GlnQ [Salinivirga cyanobacteriivorans]|uniref:Glutamine transport ATP-binding protein GlnQ n=1 Tax=Salinivirga cyanobacteriivorans TaxID=1307839 RepID=A0A0S2I124_9BACT|nr:ATP-binding cassette domain-containing protein [Salinivirga cyanobacteriivorans]ALO16010.1 Glutamine transport ATP-binding protein GlnQ [Salinivirga cyanobacteriivorans]